MSTSDTRQFYDVSSETLTNGNGKKQKGGCFCSTAVGFVLVLLAIAIAVGVGIIVFFASPKEAIECNCVGQPEMSDEQSWTECMEMAAKRNECLSAPHCPGMTTSMMDTTMPPGGTTPTTPVLDVRLPLKVYPTHYALELKPDFYGTNPDEFTFEGSVDITVRCDKATNVITLHVNKLTINEESVRLNTQARSSSSVSVTSVEEDKERQFLKIHLSAMLTVGKEYVLHIEFNGPLKPDLVGLYWSSYKTGNETRYLVTTQMQPTDARKTFPCFDEPGIKSNYSTTLVRKEHMKSISNMNIMRTDNRAGDWKADVFAETPKMPTYLLAFIVCDFEYRSKMTSDGKTMFRVWSRPDAIDQVNYALDTGVATLEYFEDYFHIEFPLPKQDMIAVPDFAAGAMENWGLIIYRETALLYDPLVSSASNKQRVAEVVVHELAHQWFGNLLTPVWWDDLWLNEGFASYMEYVGIDHVEPTWLIKDQYVVRDIQSVFHTDSLSTSHPIYIPVGHPDEINEIFDRISYLKGSSIIRMMNFFLGDDTFRNGLSRYLKRFEYGNANHTQLWQALQDQANINGQSIDVSRIMDTWVLQMGYPVVTIEMDPQGDMATAKQQHFLTDPSIPPVDAKFPSPFGYKWQVPLTYTTNLAHAWESPNLLWMPGTDMSIYGLTKNVTWIIGNVGQYGYYRVNYDMDNWNALLQQLRDDHTVIPVKNRAQIIDDAFNLGNSGYLDLLVGYRATEYLQAETDYVPWAAALGNMYYVKQMFQRSAGYGSLQKYIIHQIRPRYDALGWEYDVLTEPLLSKYMRAVAIGQMCAMGIQECRDEASTRYAQWMDDPVNNAVKADVKSTVYCNGIRNGGETEWNFAYEQYKTANVAAEARRLLQAMACAQQPWLLSRYLKMALNPEEIRAQDAVTVISNIASNPIGRSLAWDFFRAEWDSFREAFGGSFFSITNLISGVTSACNTEFELKEMEAFKEDHPDLGSGARAMDQSIERCRTNINWMTANEQPITDWLKEQCNACT